MIDLGFIHRWDPREGATRTLLLLHGTGGDENDLVPVADLLDRQANVLSPRGQVMENGMPRFFRRLSEGVFDIPDLTKRTESLGDFISAASDTYDATCQDAPRLGRVLVCARARAHTHTPHMCAVSRTTARCRMRTHVCARTRLRHRACARTH